MTWPRASAGRRDLDRRHTSGPRPWRAGAAREEGRAARPAPCRGLRHPPSERSGYPQMKRRRTVTAIARISAPAALAAGLLTAGGVAHADTNGDGGIVAGNQIRIPVELHITITGNAVGALGEATARPGGRPSMVRHGGAHHGLADAAAMSGRGILSGNQVVAPISVPVDVCGNAVALLGVARARCHGAAGRSPYPHPGHHGHHPGHCPGHHPGHHPGHPAGHGAGHASAAASVPSAAVSSASPGVAAFPPPGEHGIARLPATGAPVRILGVLAAGLVAAGVALTTVRRRRSVTVTAVPASTEREGGGQATDATGRR
jgi:hypothetical protein